MEVINARNEAEHAIYAVEKLLKEQEKAEQKIEQPKAEPQKH